MELPMEVPVMTLPNATLFPQSFLPLHIFEPRYRKMLTDALETHRMFSVAMQRPDRKRETPAPIAGLGLIRMAVGRKDGSSDLLLQGLARVELGDVVRYRPYRLQKIFPIRAANANNVVVDALVSKMRELVRNRLELGPPQHEAHLNAKLKSKLAKKGWPEHPGTKPLLQFIDKIDDPEQASDLISWVFLTRPLERQVILETVELEARLRYLNYFLREEIHRTRRDQTA